MMKPTSNLMCGGSSNTSTTSRRNAWFSGWRSFAIAGGILAIPIVGLNWNWLVAAGLLQFLFILPCAAAMMFMCMKGMSHGEKASAKQSSTPDERASDS